MKIKSISFKNTFQEWEYSSISFSNLTLLVGISGAGKTQILESIGALKKIANGSSIRGIEWRIEFETNKTENFIWEGKFENLKDRDDEIDFILEEYESNPNAPLIVYEKLIRNDKELIIRENGNIIYNGNQMPKLAPNQSVLHILRAESNIKNAHNGFQLIVMRDYTAKEGIHYILDMVKLKKKFKKIEQIQESDIPSIYKLAIVAEGFPLIFDKIKLSFQSVFPQVTDVNVEAIDEDNTPSPFYKTPMIKIREKGVKKWINQNRMSSGMLRTFMHISEMLLWKEGAVILIDEFENSLGVNCINVLIDDLIESTNKIQFIATSHHPYIINKIPYDYWKIVSRKGGKISVNDANQFNLGESNQEKFISLVNLLQYQN